MSQLSHIPLLKGHQVVLLCARKELDAAQHEHLAVLLGDKLEWTSLLRFAERHGLALLLHHHLKQFRGAMPNEPWDLLQSAVRASVMRNLALAKELREAVGLLQNHGVTAIAYKGPTQAQSAYGCLTLRPFLDLDLLVRPSDVIAARTVLLGNGYRYPAEFAQARFTDPDMMRMFENIGNEEPLERINGHGHIDLHRELSPPHFPFPPTAEEAWARRVPSELDPSVPTLCPEDTLLCMVGHASKHKWERLEWLCSFHEFLRAHGESLDWDDIKSRAGSAGVRPMLALAFRLCMDMRSCSSSAGEIGEEDSTGIPEWGALWARENRINEMSRYVWQVIFADRPKSRKRPSLRATLLHLRLYEHGQRSLVRKTAFNWLMPRPDDPGLVQLPPALRSLYIPRRLAQASFKHARIAVAIVMRKRTKPG